MDAEAVTASLAAWLEPVTFADRGTDDVTALLIDAVAAWGRSQGWRVYLRAPSVVRLPPPYAHQYSVVDVALARPTGAPIVVEVDGADRRRSVDKLRAEADAGRVALWVRWGAGRLQPPELPVRMVPCPVTSRRGLAGGARLHSRLPASDRPAPEHTVAEVRADPQTGLFPTRPPTGPPIPRRDPDR